jgi:hypothetical protein
LSAARGQRKRFIKAESSLQADAVSGGWTYTSLQDFDLLGDGGKLYGSVVLDASGNVFGVTAGAPYPNDGVAFEIMP